MSEIQTVNQERVPHGLENLEAITGFITSQTYLDDPILRRDYFEHMDETDFVDYLQRLSSLIVDGDETKCRPFVKGKGLYTEMGLDGVDERDREALVRKTWNVARGFLKDRSLGDEDALMQAGIVARAGVIATHPFDDGNGRTTRLLFFLMGYGGKDLETLRQILTKEDGHDMQFMSVIGQNIAFPKREIDPTIRMTWAQAGAEDKITESDSEEVILGESVIREFIKRYPKAAEAIIKNSYVRDEQGQQAIGIKLFMQNVAVHERALEYMKNMHDIERDEKYAFVVDAVKSFLDTSRSTPQMLEGYINPKDKPTDPKKVYRSELAKKALAGTSGKGLTQVEYHLLRHQMFSKAYERAVRDKPTTAS